jgi:peptidoglycan hydrolase CwlO-like protein
MTKLDEAPIHLSHLGPQASGSNGGDGNGKDDTWKQTAIPEAQKMDKINALDKELGITKNSVYHLKWTLGLSVGVLIALIIGGFSLSVSQSVSANKIAIQTNEELKAFKTTVSDKFNDFDKKIDKFETKVDDLDKRVGSLEIKVDGLDKRVGSLETKVDDLDKKVDGLDKKVDGLDKKVDGLDKKVNGLDKKVDGLDKKMDDLGTNLQILINRK